MHKYSKKTAFDKSYNLPGQNVKGFISKGKIDQFFTCYGYQLQTLIAIFGFPLNIYHLVIHNAILRKDCMILQKVVNEHSLWGGSSAVFTISSILQKYNVHEKEKGNSTFFVTRSVSVLFFPGLAQQKVHKGLC